MPILEITPEMIGPNRNRLGLNYIESVMLWPDDKTKRDESIRTGTATFIRDAINAMPAVKRAAEAAEWLDWCGLLADAMPLRLIQEEAKKRYVHGCLAGELLGAAVGDHARGAFTKLESLKAELCEYNQKRATITKWFDVSFSTLNNIIWTKYKPVSHLWATYLTNALAGDMTFPCALNRLTEFLAVSEVFLRRGLALPLSRRGGETLLQADRMWFLPNDLGLPLYDIEFGADRRRLR
jgi:hypothetical protein